MRFYNQQHRFYCGVDLHARTLSLCILDQAGTTILAKTIAADNLFLDRSIDRRAREVASLWNDVYPDRATVERDIALAGVQQCQTGFGA